MGDVEIATATVAANDVADDIEVLRQQAEISLEDGLSVRDWCDRVANATRQAFTLCRAGSVMEEYKTWLEIAAIAAGRAEQIRRQQINEGDQ